MKLTLVAAVARGGALGLAGGLPWDLPLDLKRFRALTLDKPLIVGRKTYTSIGRPLPRRRMVVLSGRTDWRPEGVEVVPSLLAALVLLAEEAEVCVGGGAAVFAEALPLATDFHLSAVHTTVPADVFFPPFEPTQWAVAEQAHCPADARHAYAHTWYHLVRPSPGLPAAPADPWADPPA